MMHIFLVNDGKCHRVDIGLQDTLAILKGRVESVLHIPANEQVLMSMGAPIATDDDVRKACRGKAGEGMVVTVIRSRNPSAVLQSLSTRKAQSPSACSTDELGGDEADDSDDEGGADVDDDGICSAAVCKEPTRQPIFMSGAHMVCAACAKRCCANDRIHATEVRVPFDIVCQCCQIGQGHCRLAQHPPQLTDDQRKAFLERLRFRFDHPGQPIPDNLKPSPKKRKSSKRGGRDKLDIDDKFFDSMALYASRVDNYESEAAQEQALYCVDLDAIQGMADQIARTTKLASSDAFMCALCRWYKEQFFTFITVPPCPTCQGKSETVRIGSAVPTEEEKKQGGASNVELYKCLKCSREIRFPRYNDPVKLLETRCGRCGESANCFCLICRAMGFSVRLVIDWTDHVWAELYSEAQQRWVHCDPCEGTWDKPLTYERGWGKKLSYIIAFSSEEAIDVTRRYTEHYEDSVKPRRTLANEKHLELVLEKWTEIKLKHFPSERREQALLRRNQDLKYLSQIDKMTRNGDYSGRVSGSAEWRESRGEAGGRSGSQAIGPSFSAWSAEHPVVKGDEPLKMVFVPHGSAAFGSSKPDVNDVLVLTPNRPGCRGAMWAPLPTELFRSEALLTQFTFTLTGEGHADGFAFVLQAEREDALGDGGSDLGYGGITHSVAVEFDTYDSYCTHDDPNGNHVSINTCGEEANTAHHRASVTCNTAVDLMADGKPHTVSIALVPVKSESSEQPKNFKISVWMGDAIVLCDAELPYAPLLTNNGLWIGFTAATGGLSQEHRISDVRSFIVRP